MKESTIALIAAMPEETKPLLCRIGAYQSGKLAGFPLFRFTVASRRCCLIESGMGHARAARAATALVDTTQPDVLVNFGFGGAVEPGPTVGDIVVAQRLYCCHGRHFSEEAGIAQPLSDTLASSLAERLSSEQFSIHRGTFITATEILTKSVLRDRLPAGVTHPVLEMETVAVARIATRAGIPLVAIRAISDDAAEELGFAITDFTDADMNLKISRVLLSVAKNPRLIPQLLRLARNTRIAGANLAAAVEAAVGIAGDPPRPV
jgi:adenosylhomocysteine nucleosidase